MVELASYLFWTGLALAAIASLTYIAYTASASLSLRRLSAQTSAGTVTLSGATGAPNAGLGRLATTFAALTAIALTVSLIARWIAVEHAPLSNLYEYTVALAWGVSVAWLAFERTAGARRFGLVALPIVTALLGIATLFPDEVIPLIPALQNAPLLTLHVSVVMVSYAVLTVAFSAAVIYLVQGGEGADSRVEGGDSVYEWEEGLCGRVSWESGEGHHAAQGLAYRVETYAVAVRAVLSVGGDVDHDDAGVEPLKHFVAEAHLLDSAGPEVLEQYVGYADEIAKDCLALVLAKVDGEALLAAVVLYPVRALALHDGAVAPALIAP